ncbi:GNAT family N-acetyltransferase [Arthrospira platensis SPKY1]|nr:GNAT family N-acetyltransferase [Arthrospira platensis SPKY1]
MYNSVMEMANLWLKQEQSVGRPRVARAEDAPGLTRLLRDAALVHTHVDWRLPVDWLGEAGFVLQEAPPAAAGGRSLASRLLGARVSLQACLAVAADPPPAAWVRVAALAEAADVAQTLGGLLAAVQDYLRATAVTQLAWLPTEEWPNAWLPQLGFTRVNAIETYKKDDVTAPAPPPVAGLTIRPVRAADLETLAAIEVAAFEPLWRHSAAALALARNQASSFDVAELDGEIVGFQFSTGRRHYAHLARMTIAPRVQGRGVGSALLAHAIDGYRRNGLHAVTLNTQVDNVASQRLYRRFGFQPTGERLPVWAISL